MSVQQIVQTSMNLVGGSAYMSTMRGIGNSAEHAAASIARVTSMAFPMRSMLAAAVGGLTINRVVELGSAFENTQNKIAGFLTALGETSDFTSGLRMAETVMRKVEIAAAALPGEAEDYVRVFSTGLPSLQKSVMGSMDDMLAFSNRITAIGTTFGVDSMQIANDLKRMLQVGRGGAGLDVRTFTEMLPFLQQVEGQANLNTEAFNKMTNVERAKLLEKSFEFLQPMIDNAASSWDAMSGAIATTTKTLFRLGTEPIFTELKSGMGLVNAAFFDANGNATELSETVIAISRVVSNNLVGGIHLLVDQVMWLKDNGAAIMDRVFAPRLDSMMGLLDFANGNSFSRGMTDPLAPLADSADNLIATFSYLTNAMIPLWDTIQTVTGVTEGLAMLVLPALTDAFFSIAQPLVDFWIALVGITGEITDWLMPHIAVFGQGIADLVVGIGDFLYPALKIVGSVFTWLANMIKDYVVPVFGFLVWGIGKLMSAIGQAISWLGKNASEFYGWNKKEAPKVAAEGISNWFGDLQKQINTEREKRRQRDQIIDPSNVKRRQVPQARGGTNVTQDFRFSKFTIDQQFAQGYDPDRIAVMFAKNVAGLGVQKLQSGFEPLFSVR